MSGICFDKIFDDIDSKRMEGFLSLLADDIELTIANNPAASGKEQVRTIVGAFWQSINGLKHHVRHVIKSDDYAVFESLVTYTRLDQKEVIVPCVTVIKLRGELISEWRIYVDASPVFSAA
ncbi:SnoaL-like domain protein [compost metagenome]